MKSKLRRYKYPNHTPLTGLMRREMMVSINHRSHEQEKRKSLCMFYKVTSWNVCS